MATKSPGKEQSIAVITKVIRDNPSIPEKELRGKIADAYPFESRASHIYQDWLNAVQECLWTLRRIGSKPKRETTLDHEQATLF
jgi:hypothetical protein